MKGFSPPLQVLKGILFGGLCIFLWLYLHMWDSFVVLIYVMIGLLDDVMKGYVYGVEDGPEGGYTLVFRTSEQAQFNFYRHLGYTVVFLVFRYFNQSFDFSLLLLIGIGGVLITGWDSMKLKGKEKR